MRIFITSLTVFCFLLVEASGQVLQSAGKAKPVSQRPETTQADPSVYKTKLPPDFTVIRAKLPFTLAEQEYVVRQVPIQGTPYVKYLFDGDIVVGDNMPKGMTHASNNTDHLWRGDIPVFFHKTVQDSGMCEVINAAIKEIETKSKVRFVVYSGEKDYIQVRIGDPGGFFGGSSPVGRIGGMQELILSRGVRSNLVIHELLHALGIWHEQSRPDRDQFVKINFENISDDAKFNFNKVPGTMIGGYNYESVMHYFSTAFSKNRKPTIECISNGRTVPCPSRMGSLEFTFGDINGVNTLYRDVTFRGNVVMRSSSESTNYKVRLISDEKYVRFPKGVPAEVLASVRYRIPKFESSRLNFCSMQSEYVRGEQYFEIEPVLIKAWIDSSSMNFPSLYLIVNLPARTENIEVVQIVLKESPVPGSLNKDKPQGKDKRFRAWVERGQSDLYYLRGAWFDYGAIPANVLKNGIEITTPVSDGPLNPDVKKGPVFNQPVKRSTTISGTVTKQKQN
jgi:hypothetical protein